MRETLCEFSRLMLFGNHILEAVYIHRYSHCRGEEPRKKDIEINYSPTVFAACDFSFDIRELKQISVVRFHKAHIQKPKTFSNVLPVIESVPEHQ